MRKGHFSDAKWVVGFHCIMLLYEILYDKCQCCCCLWLCLPVVVGQHHVYPGARLADLSDGVVVHRADRVCVRPRRVHHTLSIDPEFMALTKRRNIFEKMLTPSEWMYIHIRKS